MSWPPSATSWGAFFRPTISAPDNGIRAGLPLASDLPTVSIAGDLSHSFQHRINGVQRDLALELEGNPRHLNPDPDLWQPRRWGPEPAPPQHQILLLDLDDRRPNQRLRRLDSLSDQEPLQPPLLSPPAPSPSPTRSVGQLQAAVNQLAVEMKQLMEFERQSQIRSKIMEAKWARDKEELKNLIWGLHHRPSPEYRGQGSVTPLPVGGPIETLPTTRSMIFQREELPTPPSQIQHSSIPAANLSPQLLPDPHLPIIFGQVSNSANTQSWASTSSSPPPTTVCISPSKTPQPLPLLLRRLLDKTPQSLSRALVTDVNTITPATSSPAPGLDEVAVSFEKNDDVIIAKRDAIYLVEAVEDGEPLVYACKPAPESNYITKVIHDCKRNSEALYFQFGIKLHNIVDTQIAYSLIEEQEGRKQAPKDYIPFAGLIADPTYWRVSNAEDEEDYVPEEEILSGYYVESYTLPPKPPPARPHFLTLRRSLHNTYRRALVIVFDNTPDPHQLFGKIPHQNPVGRFTFEELFNHVFKLVNDSKNSLQQYDQYLYDGLILFTHSTTQFVGSVAAVLDFVDVKVGEMIIVSVALRQLPEFGLFLGDPHSVNTFAMRDGRIAYVNLGNVAVLSQQNKQILMDDGVHAVKEYYVEMTNDFTRLGFLASRTGVSSIIPALEGIRQNSVGKGLADFKSRSATEGWRLYLLDTGAIIHALGFSMIILDACMGFDRISGWSSVSWSAMTSCCFKNEEADHLHIIRSELDFDSEPALPGEKTLISWYLNCGKVDVALRIFSEIENEDGVSWKAILSGYLAWDWKWKGVIYTSHGPELAGRRTKVDIVYDDLFTYACPKFITPSAYLANPKTKLSNLVLQNVEPAMYRVDDDLEYSTEIYEWSGTAWNPYVGDDVQVQFYLMSPYVMKTLSYDMQGLCSTSFKVFDVYGVFQFEVEYQKFRYTSLSLSKQIPYDTDQLSHVYTPINRFDADMVMNLIGMMVIGQSSSLKFAALGSGTVFYDNLCYIFLFMSIATSSVVTEDPDNWQEKIMNRRTIKKGESSWSSNVGQVEGFG